MTIKYFKNKSYLGVISILALSIVIGCASSSKQVAIPEYSKYEATYDSEFSIEIPDNWHSYKDIHNEQAYKPIIYDNRFKEVSVYLRKYQVKNELSPDLESFIEKNIRKVRFYQNHKIEKQKLQTNQGETYIIEESFKLNNIFYKKQQWIFKQDDYFYEFNYSGNAALFSNHLDEANAIFQTLKLK
ncbi:hypothetical protein AAU57_08955 [Nonlabens sp. YIK11]|uniref:hypothetical protein n=1 Tax=Nonlabens sp. YIK11 TaxID=1453349 RepID=UPI0006DD310A|nr:hypothetical protein [Nonlabens sp. YIK11]KQC33430.1 hypothetical protein AAU57_08955 [Nonlabens sp. YIK11]